MKLDGRYELHELIGSGGMAEIYKAVDTVEEKVVAVKILKNEFAGSDDFLRRFRNESKAIALLSHANIVKIFDVGFTDSVQFIVMEYVDGITLTEYIERQGVLKWKEAHSYIGQILKALQHAHDRGIVHRDVKSSNVMLLRDGSIKVMDFGIARFNREIAATKSEKAIGSVHYISPEQARGEVTDEKSDLYSVGIMMYETLTGVKPFDGDDALAIALMHTNKKPKPPREINSSVPVGLEEIILRAMQKDAAQRYQTAGEMLGDLQEFEKNPSIIFEYKYFTPDGEVKHINKAGKPAPNPAEAAVAAERRAAVAAIAPAASQQHDYDDYDDDEIIERRSPLLPILFAVASAFVIVAAVVIAILASQAFGNRSRHPDMPNLVGERWELVRVNSDYNWLNFRVQEDYHPTIEAGHIISQSAIANRPLDPATTVTVVISRGRRIVRMPNLGSGTHLRMEAEVADELRSLGLVPSVTRIPHVEIPAGFFIRAEPDPDTELTYGDTVRIWVSEGDPDDPFNTSVPNLMGLERAEAEALLREHRLTPDFEFEPSTEEQRGQVIAQSVLRGTTVQINTIILLTIGEGITEGEERAAFIQIDVDDSVTGTLRFELLRNGDVVDTITRNVSVNRIVRFDFEDVGVQQYAVNVVNTRTTPNRDGVFVSYSIDFTQVGADGFALKVSRVPNPYVWLEIMEQPPQTTAATTPPTEPTTPPTEPTAPESAVE
jgi:serine/threonine-protein kinase